jgi:hypothetical protein
MQERMYTAASMSIARRLILLACGVSLAHCSLDGLADGKVSTGTGGKGTTSATSSSTGSPKPNQFTWALDLGPTPTTGTVHLAPFSDGVVIATSGQQVSFSQMPCGTDACVATIDSKGAATPLADGIGGSATKTVNGVAASADRIVVVGTFSGQSLVIGSGASALTLPGGKASGFVAMFDATTRRVIHAVRLRSIDSMMTSETVAINDVAIDAADNVYITGSYHDSLELLPAGGTETPVTGLTTGTLTQGFVMKLSPTLMSSWAVDFGTSAEGDSGSAIGVGPTGVVAFGGLARAPAILGGAGPGMKTCSEHYGAINGAMALVGFVDSSGMPSQCDSYGGFNSDVSSVVATSTGALFGGRYANVLTWPALPATGMARFGYVFEQVIGSSLTPASQPIIGDSTSFHDLNAMGMFNGSLYIGATTNGNASFKTDNSCAFPILGNDDGLVAVEPKTPMSPFVQPKGLIVGSPNKESIDTLAVTSAGGIVVGGIFTNGFDVLMPGPTTGMTDRYVGMVNPTLLASPCP